MSKRYLKHSLLVVGLLSYFFYNNASIFVEELSKVEKFNSVIIVGKARSGSNLLTSLLNTHDAFSCYEPILTISKNLNSLNFNHSSAVSDVLNCNFPSKFESKLIFTSNLHYDLCQYEFLYGLCTNILKFMCLTSRFYVIKTILLSLHDAVTAIETAKTNTAIILLVRDPRAVMASRAEFLSILSDKVDELLENHTTLCTKIRSEMRYLETNYNLRNKYIVVKYEELILQPSKTMRNIYNFLGREYSIHVDNLVNSRLKHKPEKTSVYNLIMPIRDSITRLAAWRKKLAIDNVMEIQEECKYVMEKMNYKLINKPQDLLNSSLELY